MRHVAYLLPPLLALNVAWAGTATTNLTVQINPVGAVPPVAAAAGFNTLAGNYDFSTAGYADPNTNWIDCNNTDNSKIWHIGSPGVPGSVTYGGCNVHQKFDSVAGKNIVNVHLDLSANCAGQGAYCSTSIETRNENGYVGTATYPNKYYETVARVEGSFSDTTFNSPQGVWEWNDCSSGCNGIEGDVVEFQYDSGGYGNDGLVNWASGNCSSGMCFGAWTSYCCNNAHVPSGWSSTAYHKYGMLTTSDGATNISMCWFIDDILQSCGDVPSVQSFEYAQRKFLIMTAYAAGSTSNMIASRDLDVQYIKIWSCANWATQMCNGSTKSTDGNGVTYWH